MSQINLFFKWLHNTNQALRHSDHESLVKQFDSKAEVFYENPQAFFDSDPSDSYYSTLTFVQFSDGSRVSWNYKGEVENWRDASNGTHFNNGALS